MDVWTGCGTALVTPFRQDGSLDEQALYAVTQWQIESGIDWLVACGTTAETPTLTDDEWLQVLRIVTEAAAGRVPIWAGCTHNATRQAVERAKIAARVPGVTAILSAKQYVVRTWFRTYCSAEDDDGLAHVWNALAWVANMRQRYEDWAQAIETALRHIRRAGRPVSGGSTMMLAVALAHGPRPAGEALTALDAVLGDQPYAGSLVLRGLLLAMLDRVEEAWAVALPAAERVREFGMANIGEFLAEIALVSGDSETAAAYLRDACDALEAIGNSGELSTYAPTLGRVLCKLGRYHEAEPLAQRGRELGDPEDVLTQQAWRQTQSLVHSARGQHAEAERLAREAVEFSLLTDSPLHQGSALCDLAEVLAAAGRRGEAAAALREALDRYDRKQIIPLARRTRERLDALRPPHA